jgi:protease II
MATLTSDPTAPLNNTNNTANDATAFRKFDDYPWIRDKSFLVSHPKSQTRCSLKPK